MVIGQEASVNYKITQEEPTVWFVPLAGETKTDKPGSAKSNCVVVSVVNRCDWLVLHRKACESNRIKHYWSRSMGASC